MYLVAPVVLREDIIFFLHCNQHVHNNDSYARALGVVTCSKSFLALSHGRNEAWSFGAEKG